MTTRSHAYHRDFPDGFATGRTAFDADYALFASSGVFVLEDEQRQWLLPPQRAALIPRGTVIAVHSRGPATSSSVLFCDGELAGQLVEIRVFAMNDLARLMIGRAMAWGDDAPAAAPRTRFFAALADQLAELSQAAQTSWLPRAQSRGLRAALAHGLDHLDRDVPLAELAAVAALSERTLSRRLQSELGVGWAEFRGRARMIRAMELLAAPGATVTHAGFAVGFESTSAFIRAFQRFAGQTPAAYRKTLRPANA